MLDYISIRIVARTIATERRALPTIFAFYASCHDAIPHPVICMPVASPYTGDYSFLQAFQQQERKGRIRMLRIANNKDIVTYVPNIIVRDGSTKTSLKTVEGSAVPLKHVGMCLTMFRCSKWLGFLVGPFPLPFLSKEVGSIEFFYPKEENKEVGILDPKHDVADPLSMFFNHFATEYLSRLEMNEAKLKRTTLEDLYRDTNLVGDLFSSSCDNS